MALRVVLGAVLVLSLVGCAGQDVTRPVPQPDTLVMGRIAAIRMDTPEAGLVEVEVKAGLPESIHNVMTRDGKTAPQLEKELKIRVKVTRGTVCVANLRNTDIDSFRVGQEIAVIPVPGSSAMIGTKELIDEADELYLFSSYQVRHLPGSLETMPPEVFQGSDPARINSAGTEMTPLPLANGKVFYFAVGLLPDPRGGAETKPIGAVRAGMELEKGKLAPWAMTGFRPYRVAWGKAGWEMPEPVSLPGLAPEDSARLTWVNKDETRCLVEVLGKGRSRRLFSSERKDARQPWGELAPMKLAGGDEVGDAQRFVTDQKGAAGAAAVKSDSLVYTVYEAGSSDLWMAVGGKPGQMLDPRINTLGAEFAPRVGPNALFFCRGDRQLTFVAQSVQEVRLPGRQRRVLLEATPSSDGQLLAFRVPRYTPWQLDWDLAVARKDGNGWGAPIALDEFRPE
jgi:hypothetical protein